MASIVKEGRRLDGSFVVIDKTDDLGVIPVTRPKVVENPAGKAHHAQAVGKSGVLGTRISDIADAELANATQALKLGRIDEVEKVGLIRTKIDQAMNRITDDLASFLESLLTFTHAVEIQPEIGKSGIIDKDFVLLNMFL